MKIVISFNRKGYSLFRPFSCAFALFIVLLSAFNSTYAQEVPILNYSINVNGQVQLEVNSTTDHYYVLKVKHHIDSTFDVYSSITIGNSGTTLITEPLGNYPLEHYQVLEYLISLPSDLDGDGLDDISEYLNVPRESPINAAQSIDIYDGLVALHNLETFSGLGVLGENVQWSPYLNGKEFLKFIILDFNSSNPKTYFINTNRYPLHADFANFLGVNHVGPNVVKGHIIYHPTVLSNNGTLGTFAFNYTNNESMPFATVQKTHELLAGNMPFLENNFSYYVNQSNEADYLTEIELYQNSRIPALFESDVYAGVDYWGLNQTESYGFIQNNVLWVGYIL